MANPNVRRSVQIAANMDRIARSSDLVERELAEIRGDARVAYRHCACAAREAHNVKATSAEREAMLATESLHKAGCALAKLMRREQDMIAELRAANAALEAGAPLEAVA
jgi:hypothetical protein